MKMLLLLLFDNNPETVKKRSMASFKEFAELRLPPQKDHEIVCEAKMGGGRFVASPVVAKIGVLSDSLAQYHR